METKKDYLLQTIHPHYLSLSVHLGPIKPKRNRIYLLSMPQKEKPIEKWSNNRHDACNNKQTKYLSLLLNFLVFDYLIHFVF